MIRISAETCRVIAEETGSWHAASASIYGGCNIVSHGGYIRHWASVYLEGWGALACSLPWEEWRHNSSSDSAAADA